MKFAEFLGNVKNRINIPKVNTPIQDDVMMCLFLGFKKPIFLGISAIQQTTFFLILHAMSSGHAAHFQVMRRK